MFKEILKIIPTIGSSDLNKMERSLTQRFGRIAKKFGKGLTASLAGGGIAGLALGLIDKLLNPLKETQEAIDRALKRGDDVVTNAKQFGTTAGKLFKLQALGKATGLDPEQLDVLLTKFQGAVAQAKANPQDESASSVRQFRNDTDMAESFFQFIQQLKKMDKNQQVLVQTQVFGEKQILKMADFLQTDFTKIAPTFGAADKATPGLEKLAEMNDLKDLRASQQDFNDTLKKAGIITKGMVENNARRQQLDLDAENQRIGSYKSLATVAEASTKMLAGIETGILKLADMLEKLGGISEKVEKFSTKGFWRSIFGGGGK